MNCLGKEQEAAEEEERIQPNRRPGLWHTRVLIAVDDEARRRDHGYPAGQQLRGSPHESEEHHQYTGTRWVLPAWLTIAGLSFLFLACGGKCFPRASFVVHSTGEQPLAKVPG